MSTATMPRSLASILARSLPAGAPTDGPLYPDGWCDSCRQAPCLCATCHGAGFVRDAGAAMIAAAPRECSSCGIVANRRLAALQELSILRDFETASFENWEPRSELASALTEARAYAADPRGWLVLHGDPGVGKTHLVAAIGNALATRGEMVAMHVMPALLRDLRGLIAAGESDRTQNAAAHDLLKAIQTVPILILDDLGAERETSWAIEQTYLIVEERYRRRLPLVITTNAFGQLEPRVRDRLTDEALSVVVRINAGSWRQVPTHLRSIAS